jgi:hypothetical protein
MLEQEETKRKKKKPRNIRTAAQQEQKIGVYAIDIDKNGTY